MEITLNSITVSKFQNLGESQTLEFPGPGLYSVIGKNLDDGDTNGAGKSALARALTAGILGAKYVNLNIKEAKSRILSGAPQIIERLTVNDKSVCIDRSIGGRLIISVNNEELEGKTDEIQDKFLKLVGISPEHLLHLTHKLQGSSNSFLLMKDAEKKDFLSSFFDTSVIDKLQIKNDAELKRLNAELSSETDQLKFLMGSLSILKNDVDALTQKINQYKSTEYLSKLGSIKSTLVEKELGVTQALNISLEHVLDSNAEYNAMLKNSKEAEIEWMNCKENNDRPLKELEENIASLRKAVNQHVDLPLELQNELNKIEGDLVTLKNKKEQLSTLNVKMSIGVSKRTVLETELNNIKPHNCSTCGQSITNDIFIGLKEKAELNLLGHLQLMNKLQEQLELAKSDLPDEQNLLTQKSDILIKISEFQKMHSKENLKVQLSSLESQYTEKVRNFDILTKNLKNIQGSLSFLRLNIKKQHDLHISELQNEIKSLKHDLILIEKDVEASSQLLQSANAKYTTCLNQIMQLEIVTNDLSKRIKIQTKLSEILSRNGFIGYIFDNILEEINQEVNDNIRDIPVISRFSLYFSPDHTVKSTGSTNKSIIYKIFDESDEISFETLSGAEQDSLLIAVDVAVDSVLCRRLGVNINYKILDEQFKYVSAGNKEHLLEFLKRKYHDKVILIVDHGSELNSSIDHNIIVTKQNGIATITCQNAG